MSPTENTQYGIQTERSLWTKRCVKRVDFKFGNSAIDFVFGYPTCRVCCSGASAFSRVNSGCLSEPFAQIYMEGEKVAAGDTLDGNDIVNMGISSASLGSLILVGAARNLCEKECSNSVETHLVL